LPWLPLKIKKQDFPPQMLRQKTTQANIDVNLSLPEIKLSRQEPQPKGMRLEGEIQQAVLTSLSLN
jgi:hypothetical protein